MRVIRTKEQKDNLAKCCWDPSKVAIAALSIAPLAKPETVDLRLVMLGFVAGISFAILGYIFDGTEVKL